MHNHIFAIKIIKNYIVASEEANNKIVWALLKLIIQTSIFQATF